MTTSFSAFGDEDFTPQTLRKSVAQQVLRQFQFSGAQLLLLGEANHEQEESSRFFVDVWDESFRFVALETGADFQPKLDAFMAGATDEFEFPSKVKESVFREFLIFLREHNKKIGISGTWPPVKVLAIDKPIEKDMSPMTWFQERDEHMFQQLKPYIESGQKGLVYMGGGHLTKNPIPTPKVLKKFFKIPARMETLGSKLEREFPKRAFRVWLDAEATPIQNFGLLPPDMDFIARLDPFLRKSMHLTRDKVFAVSTQDLQFLEAEADSRTNRNSIPFYIYREFNYYVSVARPASKGTSLCGALLTKDGRELLLRGLRMRAP